MDQVLDGKTPVKVVPFDAHEQAVRVSHTYDAKEGYKADPEFEPSEYPKVIAHNAENTEPAVIAKDADHEAELTDTPVSEGEKAEE